jgi:hypothetical protein
MALNNDVSQRVGQWFGDATEIALVQYALIKKPRKIELEKNFQE